MLERRLTKTNSDNLEKGERDTFYWDDEVAGFGLKVTPAGGRIFVFQYRMGGRGAKTKRWKWDNERRLARDCAQRSGRSSRHK